MGLSFLVTNYAEASTWDNKNGGPVITTVYNGPVYNSFPTGITKVVALSPPVTIATKNWVLNSMIEVYPSGLTTPGFTKKYLSDATIGYLQSYRN